ncbi:hypothetical protein [Alkaliphilus crotonatoxidans]
MKKLKGMIIGLLALTVVLLVGQVVYAAAKEPGTADDPLVTLSFVEQKLEQIKFYVDERLKGTPQTGEGTPEGAELVVVELKKGEALIGAQGTEIILRSGDAVAIDSPSGGLADVTGARDITADEAIPTNHLIIIPRDDGRGVRAKNDTFFMVRGSYTIQQP